ncbi:MgtC/SapB family protein [Gudongella sp. SC589]|jgi:putative Mg2+ transporter-C (MgtC) family protein|uniref:MgtC/SapB family protein n=1 Tax=Gudongella sp. SC589 TaxID=3385990 RepID=UPI003904679B
MIGYPEVLARLLISALLGGIIGIEREASNRPAGFRTHILVSVGSTLIMLVSMYAVPQPADRARIAAQVVSGIGFLGAGTILRTGNHIRGLTTAASLWVCAGIGLAVGSGYYFGGVVTAMIVLISLVVLSKVEKNVLRGANRLVKVTAVDRSGLIGEIGVLFGKYNISIRNISIEDVTDNEDEPSGVIELKFYIKKPMGFDNRVLDSELLQIKGIKSIDFDESKIRDV